MFSLRYCKDIVNWLFLVLIACLAMHTQSDAINFVCLPAKNQLLPHVFMGIFQRSNLFWVFWACLVTLTQNDGITSQKTSMFFCLNLSKNEFSWKKGLSVFQYSNYLLLYQKSEKPNQPFLRKLLDGHTKNQFIPLISL